MEIKLSKINYKFRPTKNFIRKHKKLKRRDLRLYKKIKKTIEMLTRDPNYPSLRLHKLSGGLKDVWSISVDRSYRILLKQVEFENGEKVLFIFDFGTHDQAYRK